MPPINTSLLYREKQNLIHKKDCSISKCRKGTDLFCGSS